MTLTATIAGYPRIGADRELKKSLEALWAGKISHAEYVSQIQDLQLTTVATLAELGLDTSNGAIPDSFSAYDQVLDTTVTLGAIPARFAAKTGTDAYFSLARGDEKNPPLEMTKWFDTNYHYLVPEIEADTTIALTDRSVIERTRFLADHGYRTRPVIVGPVTWLALAKSTTIDPLDRLDDAITAFATYLDELSDVTEWVQFDEPALVSDNLSRTRHELAELTAQAYERLAQVHNRPQILLNLPYGDSSHAVEHVARTGVEAIGIDLVRGKIPTGDLSGITLAAGVVDGRNIWRTDLQGAVDKLEALKETGATVIPFTSNSLQHLPHDVQLETWSDPDLDAALHTWLTFANQKVEEVVTLGRGLGNWDTISADIAEATAALEHRASYPGVEVPHVRKRIGSLSDVERQRQPFAERRSAQASLNLPLLPTTTIGSFPQTAEVRKNRADFAAHRIDEQTYRRGVEAEIRNVIDLQEKIGLDVLAHGEAERNDMVQYFAELLDGCSVTRHGWVQSYGSRCTRPSILWGDISRSQDLSTSWWEYAQSLTDKPVKGMLTGPVTIIAWSFPRQDIPLSQVADQLGLALRDEVESLEHAGARIIQVDEPALRELLPLDQDRQADYLSWSVGSFRLATSGVRPETQIHTHLCYSEFGQVISSILDLDADVTSIEAARSNMEVVPELVSHGYTHGVGPGVWDIHSPRVPTREEVTRLVRLAADSIDPHQLWINPDCGLKTRGYEETIASLTNLVEAARTVRESS